MHELAAWIRSMRGDSCRSDEAHRMASETYSLNTEGGQTFHHERRMMLPSSLNGISKKRWVSGGAYLPRCLSPLSISDERRIVVAMVDELNTNLGADLDLLLELDREDRLTWGLTPH